MKELFSIAVPVAAIAGTVVQPLFRVPTGASSYSHGGITIQNAYIMSSGAATSELQLLKGTTTGTASTGTIGTLNATLAANVQQAFTVSSGYVASGSWVQVKTNAGGSLATTNVITVEYVWGK